MSEAKKHVSNDALPSNMYKHVDWRHPSKRLFVFKRKMGKNAKITHTKLYNQ